MALKQLGPDHPDAREINDMLNYIAGRYSVTFSNKIFSNLPQVRAVYNSIASRKSLVYYHLWAKKMWKRFQSGQVKLEVQAVRFRVNKYGVNETLTDANVWEEVQ